MFQLVYISSAAMPTGAAEIDAILASSRRNNALAGITGLLLYDGVRFLQALEGPAGAVEATFQRISADPRHRAIVPLSHQDVAAAQFGRWDMASHAAAPGPGDAASLAEIVDGLVADVTDADLRALFTGFVRLRRNAA